MAAGVVFGQKGKVGIRSVNNCICYFFLFSFCILLHRRDRFLSLVGLFSHVDDSFRIGNGLGLVGSSVRQGYADGPGISVGHFLARLLVRVAHYGLRQHVVRVKDVAIVYSYVGNQMVVLAAGQGLAMIDGYARQAHRDGASFCVDLRGIDGLHGDGVRRKGIAAVVDPDGGIAVGSAFGHVHGINARTCAHTFGLRLYTAAALGLQNNLLTLPGDFGSLVAVCVRNLPGLRGGDRQRAAARNLDVVICFVVIMGHADRHGHQARRRADDLALAPGIVLRYQLQVAGSSSDCTVVHRDASARALFGFALDSDTGVAYADGGRACAGLDHAGIDGVVFIASHIALMGVDGHSAACDGRIRDANIAHFVQVEHHVGHIDGHHTR